MLEHLFAFGYDVVQYFLIMQNTKEMEELLTTTR